MSDWQIGDKLVHIKADCPSCPGAKLPGRLRRGAVYEFAGRARSVCGSGLGIKLAGVLNSAPDIGWCPAKFRKIRPDEQEACEPEFVTLLKRSKVSA